MLVSIFDFILSYANDDLIFSGKSIPLTGNEINDGWSLTFAQCYDMVYKESG